MFPHGSTYSGHATCCAAALANLEVLQRDGLVHRARELERPFHERLSQLEAHPLVSEVRGGLGLMAAVALRDRELVARLWRRTREHGLLTRMLPDGLALAPPLIVEDEHVELAVAALDAALSSMIA